MSWLDLHVDRWLPANNNKSLGRIAVSLGDTSITGIPVRLGKDGIVVGKPSSRTITGNLRIGNHTIPNSGLKFSAQDYKDFASAVIEGIRARH